MPIDALRFIRKMRGGAQAHLLEAADKRFYVVKFVNNPQHRRILVNEWISAAFLKFLGISTPEAAIVNVPAAFLQDNPDVHLQLGSRRSPIDPGWHFGSRYPADPARAAVYDFLPDSVLNQVENLEEFAGALAFDKWMSNADSRQAIFFRARLKEFLPTSPANPARLGFVAQMMDNGYVFDGPNWRLTNSPVQGLYFRPSVYKNIRGWRQFEPWIERIRNFPEEVADESIKRIPPAWLENDRAELERLIDRLFARRKQVAEQISECRKGRIDPFPEWQNS